MNDDRLIRLNNLRRLCAERRIDAAALAKALPHARYTYWRDLLLGDKAFGEKQARKVEEGLGLPHKWLDTPRDAMESREAATPSAHGPGALSDLVMTNAADDHWRQVAELVANVCTKRDMKMLPATFLIIADAAVELVGEEVNLLKIEPVLDKLFRVLQHGKNHTQD